MARGGWTRRIRGPALQRRGGGESGSHDSCAEKRSTTDYRRTEGGRAASGRADATSRASRCARKVSDAAEGRYSIKSSCARESNESSESNEVCARKNSRGKNRVRENKLSAAQRIKKFSEARKFATATIRAG
jgi:hypothetical protein